MGIHTNCYILLHNKRCIIVKNAVNCSIIKGVFKYGSTIISEFMLVGRWFIHLFNARKLKKSVNI